MNKTKIRKNILYPDLSYQIVGSAFEVFNELGFGHLEKTYEKAMEVKFKNKGIKFKSQVRFPVTCEGIIVGNYYFDFLIEDKIIVELKCGSHFSRSNFQQVHKYLATNKVKLAILLTFTKDEVLQKRTVNDYDDSNKNS